MGIYLPIFLHCGLYVGLCLQLRVDRFNINGRIAYFRVITI